MEGKWYLLNDFLCSSAPFPGPAMATTHSTPQTHTGRTSYSSTSTSTETVEKDVGPGRYCGSLRPQFESPVYSVLQPPDGMDGIDCSLSGQDC